MSLVLFNFAKFLIFVKDFVHEKNVSPKSKLISYYFSLTACPQACKNVEQVSSFVEIWWCRETCEKEFLAKVTYSDN